MTAAANRSITALVLAGQRPAAENPLAGVEGCEHKGLLEAGGRPLIARVADALAAAGDIASIKIAAPAEYRSMLTEALAGRERWSFVAASTTPAATILAALDEPWARQGFLVTTCDHALLTPVIVEEFLRGARGAEAAAGCVEQAIYQSRFPGSRRTFIKLRDFSFSGANLFWFSGPGARNLVAFWRRLELKRKKPLAMALEIGLGTALWYATGNITRASLELLIRRRTGVAAKLIALTAAEAAIDVDKPEDLTLVRRLIAEGAVSA
jgi:molybdopterin-guanine dinucleotide biosynthesis protein A